MKRTIVATFTVELDQLERLLKRLDEIAARVSMNRSALEAVELVLDSRRGGPTPRSGRGRRGSPPRTKAARR